MAININTFAYGATSISISLAAVLLVFGSKNWFWFLIVGSVLGLVALLS